MLRELRRIPLVGVIGGEDRSGCARLVGRELIKNNCAILTGGCPQGNPHSIKNAVILGALDAEQHSEGIARFIGIMLYNGKQNFTFESLTSRQLIIHTDLSSLDRDPINGTTPDVLICFDGGPGTICELAFGIALGRHAIFHRHSAQNLLEKCDKSKRTEIKQILTAVAHKWRTHLQMPDGDADGMMNILRDYLLQATNRSTLTSSTDIVNAALKLLPTQLSNIPSFPGVLDSQRKQQQQNQFAEYWTSISNDNV